MSDAKLRDGYRRFGFIGATSMSRPQRGEESNLEKEDLVVCENLVCLK